MNDKCVRVNLVEDHRDSDGEPVHIWKIRHGEHGVKTMWNPHQRAEICKRKRQELQGELTEVRLKKM